jgi:hypothetical protein
MAQSVIQALLGDAKLCLEEKIYNYHIFWRPICQKKSALVSAGNLLIQYFIEGQRILSHIN